MRNRAPRRRAEDDYEDTYEEVDPVDLDYVSYLDETGEDMSFDEYIDRLYEGDLE